MTQKRRDFIKQLGILGASTGLVGTVPMTDVLYPESEEKTVDDFALDKPLVLNILQTTDVHCQLHPHDELFWENNQSVFRKTGGYAYLATYFKNERSRNPNTFILDTGDMFQGSELSVKTTGESLVPILNALDYNLYIPGNWEDIYYKKAKLFLFLL